MNVYTFRFSATCPVDARPIDYAATIVTCRVIPAELLTAWASEQSTTLHEDAADDLHARFGGRQIVVATHSGVLVQTLRP